MLHHNLVPRGKNPTFDMRSRSIACTCCCSPWPWSCTDPSRGPLSRSPPRPPRKAVKPTRHTSSRQPLDVGEPLRSNTLVNSASRHATCTWDWAGGHSRTHRGLAHAKIRKAKHDRTLTAASREARCLLVLLLCLSTLSRPPTTHGQTQLEQLSLPIIHAKQPSFLCPLHPILLHTLLPIA